MKKETRTESDFIGVVTLPASALYGIHAWRAKQNFPFASAFHPEWYKALGMVKAACYITARRFQEAVEAKFGNTKSIPEAVANKIPNNILSAIEEAAMDIQRGEYFDHFIIPAVSGGAGTSINLNINEIIANAALTKLGENPGNYKRIDPIEHANLYQSTNDVIPTSLKVAAMHLLNELEDKINELRNSTEKLERMYGNTVRMAYTQMQEAVPSSYGMLFSSWSDALSRDWWRITRCHERIKVVNLGGSAVGTGLTVPRFFIMEVVPELQRLTGLPVTRGENLVDTTQNLDSFVEVHGILKAHAVNLEKMASDVRLLASDISKPSELSIPPRQVGSSIMPGKINPVISEFVISSAHKVYSNDMLISNMSGQGSLDLNAYLPVIGHALLESLKLLIAATDSLKKNLFDGLEIDSEISRKKMLQSPGIATALVPVLGYNKAAEIAYKIKVSQKDIFQVNEEMPFMDAERLKEIMKPDNLLKLGYSVSDF